MNVTTTSLRQGKFETRFWHKLFEEEVGRVKGHFGPINTYVTPCPVCHFLCSPPCVCIELRPRRRAIATPRAVRTVLCACTTLTRATSARSRMATSRSWIRYPS